MVCILCGNKTNNQYQVVGGFAKICVDCELKLRDILGRNSKSFFCFLQKQFDCTKTEKINDIKI